MSDAIDPAAPEPIADPTPGDPSSRNAVTHGLTARRPLDEEEAERMVLIAESWARHHHPETEPEEALIQSAAIEYVRYLRCVDAEERRMGPAIREALDAWEETKRHATRRKAQDLRDEPGRVAAELHESAFGIDWMLRHWRTLLGHLDGGRGWRGDDLATAMRLIGREATRPAASDVEGRGLWEATWAACPATMDLQAPAGIADAEAGARLRALVAERIARLEALRPVVWEEVDEPEARSVESLALSDTSKEGQLRHRYRREAFRDWQKSLSMIMRLKVERSKIADRDSRCDRREQSSRPWSGRAHAAEPPAIPPAAPPPPPPAGPAAAESRNEPSGARPPAPEHRPNPNEGNGNGADHATSSPEAPRRTEAVPSGAPEAHRPPIGGPSDPRRPDPGARVRPPTAGRDG